MNDPYEGWAFPRLHLRQGDYELILPVYQDMRTAEGLVTMADYLDVKLLKAAGCVLPTREWRMVRS